MVLSGLRYALLLLVVGLTLIPYQCSFPGESNGSGIGNGKLTGRIINPDGKTPATGVSVAIWERDARSSVTPDGEIRIAEATQTTQTNESGNYLFDKIKPGRYSIIASDDDKNMARIDSFDVESDDERIELPTDTLKAAGAIKGKVVFEDGNDTIEAYITCAGTEYSRILKNGEEFLFAPLAEGLYGLDIDAWEHSPFNNVAWVQSGDTTEIAVITLFHRLESVEGVRINKNPEQNSNIISWKTVYSSNLAGYNLYRRSEGQQTFGNPLNGSTLISDTEYVDTDVSDETGYEYAVQGVDKSDRVGPLSYIVSTATYRSTLEMDTFDLALSGADDIYFLVESKNPDFLYLRNPYDDTLTNEASCNLQKYVVADKKLVGVRKIPHTVKDVVDENDLYYYSQDGDNIGEIYSVDAESNKRQVATYETGTLLNYDVHNNSIVIVTEIPWDGSVSSDGSATCLIRRILIDEGKEVYSRTFSTEVQSYNLLAGGWGGTDFRDVLLEKDGTVRVFFATHIRVFDGDGNETDSIGIDLGNRTASFSSSFYLMDEFNNGVYDFVVNNFTNRTLFWRGGLKGDWIFYLIAPDNAIYLSFFDTKTRKTVVCRLNESIGSN